ncbi:MAG: PAS domain-containing protein [Candidatus Taylorbacteria bacterium]|nr:PAS domain-containing protein [Candidatus Taylorbacteria bacterium]
MKKTERVTESELNILYRQMNRAQEIAKVGSWSWDSIEDKIIWSKELYNIYVLDSRLPAPNYKEHLKLYSLESRKILDSAVQKAIKKGTPYEVRLSLSDTSNGEKWVVGKGEVIRNPKGQIVGQSGTVQDITLQKRSEDKIIRNSALIKSLLDSTPDIIFYKDLDGVYLGCNTAFAEFVGLPKEKIIGSNDYVFFSKDVADAFRGHDKLMLKLNKSRHNEEWITYPNGKKILIDTLKTPYYGPDNEKIGILGISRDITNQKMLEDEINQNLEQQRFLSEISVELNQSTDFESLMNDALKKLAIFTKAGRSYIFKDSMDGKSTSNVYEWCAGGVNPEINNLQNISYSSMPSFLKAFKEYGMLKSDDVSKMPKDLRDILEPQGIKSILLLPMYIGNRRLGFLGLDIINDKRDWKTEEIHLLKTISDSIAILYSKKEIDNIKSEFISVASHQLKTPLTGIKWMTNLLLNKKIERSKEKQKEYIQNIYYNNERMIKLVNNLLDISNIESGRKFKILKKKTNIMSVLDHVLLDIQPFAKDKEIYITKCESMPKEFIINIDGDKMRQVFNNLITNAIKYSKEKGVVEIDFDHKGSEVIFKVKDSGIGIPNGQKDKIFEKFYRADNAIEKEPEGSGLGLYITKLMVEAHPLATPQVGHSNLIMNNTLLLS